MCSLRRKTSALRGPPTLRTLSLRFAAVAAIGAIDAVIWRHRIPKPLFAALDETGHLLTATLSLTALAGADAPGDARAMRRFATVALSSAVLVDLDHVPRDLFGFDLLTRGMPRPIGHTLLTVCLGAGLAVLLRSPQRRLVARAASAGVGLHLIRDLATGGAPLLWPASSASVTCPYPAYLLLMAAAALAPAIGPPRVRVVGHNERRQGHDGVLRDEKRR